MKTTTILKLASAGLACCLLAAAAFFWTHPDGQEQSAGLITAALGLVALVTRSPLSSGGQSSSDDEESDRG